MSQHSFGVRQIQGDRARQEDFYGYQAPPGDGAPDLMVVADGMGGHAGGDVASRLVVETFIAEYARRPKDRIPDRLRGALEAANEAVATRVRSDPDLAGMGSTLVAVVLTPEGLYWISVGDSPMWRVTARGFDRLNQDHSMAPLLALKVAEGELTQAEAARDPRRNQILSAVDGGEMDLIDCRETPMPLEAGDLILLATDGVETLSAGRIMDLVRANVGGGVGGVAEAVMAAVEAEQKPRQDNATLAIRRVEAASIAPQASTSPPPWRASLLAATLVVALLAMTGALWFTFKGPPAPGSKGGPVVANSSAGKTTPPGQKIVSAEERFAQALSTGLEKAGAEHYALVVLPKGEGEGARVAKGQVRTGGPNLSVETLADVGEIGHVLTAMSYIRSVETAKLPWDAPIDATLPRDWSVDPAWKPWTFLRVLNGGPEGCAKGVDGLKACLADTPKQPIVAGKARFLLMRVLLAGLGGAPPPPAANLAQGYVNRVNAVLLKPMGVSKRDCEKADNVAQAMNGLGSVIVSAGEPDLVCGAGGWRLSALDLARVARSFGVGLPQGLDDREAYGATSEERESGQALWSIGRVGRPKEQVVTLMLKTSSGQTLGLVLNDGYDGNLDDIVIVALLKAGLL